MKNLATFLLIMLLLASCKKEKTTWTTDWNVPIVHGTLTLDNLLADQYTTTNSDNYLSIVYDQKAVGISLDTLVVLPDTSITNKTVLAFPVVTINPGFTWSDAYDQLYDLGDIEIKKVICRSGTVTFTLRSPWPGKTLMTMDFPKIILNGTPFLKSYHLEPGTLANPAVEVDAIDMSGYLMDMTGVSGQLYNTLSGTFILESDETTATYQVTNQDSVEYQVAFSDVEVDYAQGYFGMHSFSDTTSIHLDFMDKILSGTIDIDSIDLNLKIKNGFNLIAQATITMVRGINSKTGGSVDLSFPDLGNVLNINPATGEYYNWQYSEYPLIINNSNSNIVAFIENMPDSILVGYDIVINPFGNVTGGNDEIFPGSTFDLFVDGEFPVNFGANALTLTDTFDFSYTGNSSYTGESAFITLGYTNGFPLEATTTLYMLDENDNVLTTITGSTSIKNGIYDSGTYLTTETSGEVNFELNDSQILALESTKKMAVVVAFTTDSAQKVKVQQSAQFDFLLKSNLQISIHL
ncbi:MAG: hypothetical protein R2780_12820 [Crocinitomicaceae bacterium]